MRILHVIDHSIPLQSGYTFRSLAIFRQQNVLGWTTFHLTGPKHSLYVKHSPEQEVIDGLLFYRTSAEQGFINKLPVVNQLAVITALKKRLLHIIPQLQPDILHAHSPALNGIAIVAVGKKLSIPTVYEVRGFWEDAAVSHGTSRKNSLRYKITRAMETWVLKQVDAVTCICEGIKIDLIKRGIPEERVTIIPNAVDLDQYQVITQRDSELELSFNLQNKSVIGFVGSFYAYEGLTLLVDAMPILLKSNPDIRLLLVGGGLELDRLKERAKLKGIEKQIVFTGRIANNQIARYYSLIDILCYPRLSMRLTETVTPLKPLEAMAQQKLVIASDVGGHRELIRDGETGILFKAGDANDLAQKVRYMLASKHEWPQLLSAARCFIEEERTWTKSVSNYSRVYENVCEAKSINKE